MPFIPGPPGAIRVVIDMTLLGQQCINVLHYVCGTIPPTQPDVQLLADEIYAAITTPTTGLCEAMGPEVVFNSVTATSVTAAGGVWAIESGPGVGTGGTPAMTNSLAVCVSLRTALSGRSFRGRTYLAGVAEGNLADPNHLDGTSAGNIAAFYENDLLTVPAALTPSFILSVASYYTGNPSPPPSSIPRATAVYTPVTAVLCNTRLDQQRRRMPVN